MTLQGHQCISNLSTKVYEKILIITTNFMTTTITEIWQIADMHYYVHPGMHHTNIRSLSIFFIDGTNYQNGVTGLPFYGFK